MDLAASGRGLGLAWDRIALGASSFPSNGLPRFECRCHGRFDFAGRPRRSRRRTLRFEIVRDDKTGVGVGLRLFGFGFDLVGIRLRLIFRICIRFGIFKSEEHTSELQSLMRLSYSVFCLKKKK